MKPTLSLLCLATSVFSALAQPAATVTETVQTLKTYPFSDPTPIANPDNLYYPYFRFDGFSAEGKEQTWKVVELENPYVKLSLFPEIGGKIWGATDKTAGKEFIYNNHVVKFRDIAMRGPWTSGGIEFNFGIIGHAPTSSTPVDYLTQTKTDGSVSCYLSSFDYITRTFWSVEVNLPNDRAYFTTRTTWYNASSLDQPYYQWMNAGYKASAELEFCYPGTHYIGHGGEVYTFPEDEEGRDISWYKNNDSGNSKSYHVLGYYNDFYGAYWHDEDFGSVHHAGYDRKLGMKIFLWGLSREGGIWEDLLTDTDGQYVELQSGRMFNQPATNSSRTPYKHFSFAPQATDEWTEYWFPARGTKGISKAGKAGALKVLREGGFLKLYFSPVQTVKSELAVYSGNKKLHTFPLEASVETTWKDSLPLTAIPGEIKVVIGDNELIYSERKEDNLLNRPKLLPDDFNWDSAYGLYTQGVQWMNQKYYPQAEKYLKASLDKEKYFAPALNSLASLYYRQGKTEEALGLSRTALSLNAYDGEANYLYGLCNLASGNVTDAKDGFSIASFTPAFRSAAYTQLAVLAVREKNWAEAEIYALQSLETNTQNLHAQQLLAVIYRKTSRKEQAKEVIDGVLSRIPLYHPLRFENYLLQSAPDKEAFTALVRNELPAETYMEIASWYETLECTDEALELLSFASESPIANYRAAWLLHSKGEEAESMALLQKANSQSPRQVFPFRAETKKALAWAATRQPDWKIDYYLGLIYWANQDKTKALELLDACTPANYAPFYLTRALLKTGEAQLSDLLRAEQTEASWRTGFALLTYYTAHNQWKEAAAKGKQYYKKYPGNYYIGLKYAKALCETNQYASCLSLLKKLNVLPNEGAYAGRAVYREAHIYQALDALNRGKYMQALASVEASKVWIENLGVGKPYDNMIDNRVENFIEAQAYSRKGDKEKAGSLYREVAGYETSPVRFRSGDLLTACALRAAGKQAEAGKLVTSWKTAFPDNRIAAWCIAVYEGDTATAEGLLATRSQEAEATPWETSYRDVDFNLIVKLMALQEK